jgi:hypothetical protein
MSAAEQDSLALALAAAQGSAYLMKPFGVAELTSAIERRVTPC